MNKARIFGILLFIIGVAINYLTENSGVHFISGFLIGLSIAFIIIGRFNLKKVINLT